MLRKIAPWAGIAGPALFVLSFTVNGLLRPGYDPVRTYVSELSIGPWGWIQIISFILLGLFIMLFSFGLKAVFRARLAAALYQIVGVCYFLSGPFITDPAIGGQPTLQGLLHGIFGAVVFSLSAAGCFVLWRLCRAGNKGRLAALSLTCGIAMSALIVLMKIGQLQPGPLRDWAGVVQRGCLVLSYVPPVAVSFWMRKAH